MTPASARLVLTYALLMPALLVACTQPIDTATATEVEAAVNAAEQDLAKFEAARPEAREEQPLDIAGLPF